MPENTGHSRRKRNGSAARQLKKAELHLHLLRLLLRRADHRKKATLSRPLFCHQLLRLHRNGCLHGMRPLRETLPDGCDHPHRENLPGGSRPMHRVRTLCDQMQTQGRAPDEKGQVDRTSAEHGDFVFKHPDGTGRPEKDDRQYAEIAFRETFVIYYRAGSWN